MKQLRIVPDGWPCLLGECRCGLFMFKDCLGFKSEYGPDDVYVVESGEVFWGGTKSKEKRLALPVQPCKTEWWEEE